MPRLLDTAYTGQVIIFDYMAALMPASAPPITHRTFQLLRENIKHASPSLHSKPETPDCLTAAAIRVRNDLGIGIKLPNELKGRIFMAETNEGDDIIILNCYPGDCRANIRKLGALLPKDPSGLSCINLPHSLTLKQAKHLRHYDPLDVIGMRADDSPYAKAAIALGLQIGEINPISILLRAEELGIKIICVFDQSLFKNRDVLSTNAGSRNFGIFVEDGVEYMELVISMAKNVEIDGREYDGAIIGNFAERMEIYKQPPPLAQLHMTLDAMEKGIRQGWQR